MSRRTLLHGVGISIILFYIQAHTVYYSATPKVTIPVLNSGDDTNFSIPKHARDVK